MTRRRVLKTALLLLTGIVAAVELAPAAPPIDAHPQQWRSGDIIFLNGTSLRSRAVRALQGYSTDYSHVGLIAVEDEQTFIIHADPAAGFVVKQPWREVVKGADVVGGAVYRLPGITESVRHRICATACEFAARRVPFDENFDRSTASRLYCTELVWRLYLADGVELRSTADASSAHILPIHLINGGRLVFVGRF